MAISVKYAGTDLSTLGVALQLADNIRSAPMMRAENMLVPYQWGRRWIQKYYEQRSLRLQGIVNGISVADIDSKVDSLKNLFPIGAGEQKLEVQRSDGTFRYIMCEARNIAIAMDNTLSPFAGKYSIDLVASDPLWYSSALEAFQSRTAWTFDSGVNFDDQAHWFDQTNQYFSQILTRSPSMVEASNAGDAPVRKIKFILGGSGLVNPFIKNLRNGLSMTFARTFLSSDTLLIDCGAQQLYLNGAPVPATGLLTLGMGQTDWMRLEPGENTLSIGLGILPLGSAGYTVNYQAQYSAAWL